MNILDWAENSLKSKYNVLSIDKVFIKPYSQLYRINAVEGVLYLKANNDTFNYEHKVTQYLYKISPSNNLNILFSNDELNAFIAKDLGEPLCDRLNRIYDFGLIESSLMNYADIQQKVSVDELKVIGIRDLSIESLESKFFDYLSSTNPHFDSLLNIRRFINSDINELLDIGIVNSIEHGDFHLGNILVNDKNNITYIDWAEATITNPLFSLISFNFSLFRRLGVNTEDKTFINLNKKYLNSFLEHYGIQHESIKRAYFLTQKIFHLYYVLTMKDIMAFNPERKDWQSRIEHSINDILKYYK